MEINTWFVKLLKKTKKPKKNKQKKKTKVNYYRHKNVQVVSTNTEDIGDFVPGQHEVDVTKCRPDADDPHMVCKNIM